MASCRERPVLGAGRPPPGLSEGWMFQGSAGQMGDLEDMNERVSRLPSAPDIQPWGGDPSPAPETQGPV